MSKQKKKNDFVCFPVRGSEKTMCPNPNELTRSLSQQLLTVINKINKKFKVIKKVMQDVEQSKNFELNLSFKHKFFYVEPK